MRAPKIHNSIRAISLSTPLGILTASQSQLFWLRSTRTYTCFILRLRTGRRCLCSAACAQPTRVPGAASSSDVLCPNLTRRGGANQLGQVGHAHLCHSKRHGSALVSASPTAHMPPHDPAQVDHAARTSAGSSCRCALAIPRAPPMAAGPAAAAAIQAETPHVLLTNAGVASWPAIWMSRTCSQICRGR